jgi:hypothetical protein
VSDLPKGTSIVEGASFIPCCDVCGWIGKDCWSEGDARSAVKAHARGQEHQLNTRPMPKERPVKRKELGA